MKVVAHFPTRRMSQCMATTQPIPYGRFLSQKRSEGREQKSLFPHSFDPAGPDTLVIRSHKYGKGTRMLCSEAKGQRIPEGTRQLSGSRSSRTESELRIFVVCVSNAIRW